MLRLLYIESVLEEISSAEQCMAFNIIVNLNVVIGPAPQHLTHVPKSAAQAIENSNMFRQKYKRCPLKKYPHCIL